MLSAIVAHAQTPVSIMPQPFAQFFDSNGVPLAFGCVFTYTSGTTNNLVTYTDYTGTIANPNPVPLNAAGAAGIWLKSGQAYTIAIFSNGGTNCSLGTQIESVDGIGGGLAQAVTPVPSSATPSFVVTSQIQVFTLTLTADATALPVSFVGVQAPVLITFQITQDGVGGHAYICPANVTGCAAVDSAAGVTTSQTFVWNGTTILPVGSGFTSTGNTRFGGNITTANTYTAGNTHSATDIFSVVQDFTGIIDSTLSASLPLCTNGSKQLITTNCLATYVHTLSTDGTQTTAAANTTSLQTLKSFAIPSAALNVAGSSFRITAGIKVTPGGAGPPTSGVGIYFGITAFSASITQGAAANPYVGTFSIVCTVTTPGPAAAVGCVESSAVSGAGSPAATQSEESITLNTTAPVTIAAKCSFSAGSTSNVCEQYNLTIEQLN